MRIEDCVELALLQPDPHRAARASIVNPDS
jgi:hypothetical protein